MDPDGIRDERPGDLMEPKPHQTRGVDAVADAFDAGRRRICLTAPTGGGKTLMMLMMIRRLLDAQKRVVLYTNRRLLISQLQDFLVDARVAHGVRAAGHEADHAEPLQISSIQTEASRTLKRSQWCLHAAGPRDLAIFDEGHLHTNGDAALEIRRRHLAGGAFTLDVTATPLGMAGVCDEIITAGTVSQLRDAGMLVLAEHYAPDEPDWNELKRLNRAPQEGEDFSDSQQRKLMGSVDRSGRADKAIVSLHGRVWAHFERLNPTHRPTILFAPGVAESLWIAQQFHARGVPAAHIDSKTIWRDHQTIPKTEDSWHELLADSKAGRIKVICNRFVLREGIDAPWLEHGIFACCFGSVQSYLQSSGRLLRATPGIDRITIQDHGGNFWRHGSVNVDHIWQLEDDAPSVFRRRAERIREKRERPPVVCPKCARVLNRRECPCGYVGVGAVVARPVYTTDGLLRTMTADYFPARRRTTDSGLIGQWIQVWKRCCSVKWYGTWSQAEAFFANEMAKGQYPDRLWPLMPLDPDRDIPRRVLDTPVDRLRGSPELLAKMRAHQERQLAKLEEQQHGLYEKKGEEADAPAESAAGNGAEG